MPVPRAAGTDHEAPLQLHVDGRLLRRMLGYVRPQWPRLAVAVGLTLLVTAAGAVGPYLFKVAIDDHLLGFMRPMLAFAPGAVPPQLAARGVTIGDRVLVREPEGLPGADRPSGLGPVPRMQVLRIDGRPYLLEGVVAPHPGEVPEGLTVRSLGDGRLVAQAPRLAQAVAARPLDVAQWRQLTGSDRAALARLAALFLALTAGAQAMGYGLSFLVQRAGQETVYRIRSDLFRHITGRAMAFFDRQPSGRLVTRLTNDTEALSELYTSALVNLFRDLFLLVVVLVAMARLDLRLTGVSLLIFPVVAGATVAFRVRAREAYRATRVALARVNAFLAENLAGMWLVQAFAREARQLARFDRENRGYLGATWRELQVYAVFRPVVDVLGNGALALMVWYGGQQVLGARLEFGVLYAFTSYIRQLFQPVGDLAEKFNIVQAAMAAAERIFQVLDDPTALTPASPSRGIQAAALAPRARGHVRFEGVWFAYGGEEWVLQDVSFEVPPGRSLGLVGATGAGKSSIVSLLARLYDVQRGAVRIDGMDVREVPEAWLRRQVAVVPQEATLFSGTVSANIRLATDAEGDSGESTPAAVVEAARAIGVDRFVARLPQGYDTGLQENGAGLSAGQRQLIALARAVHASPAILVLDEATAHIDSETEDYIQQALRRLAGHCTLVIVAHRLSTVRHADRIVVLHEGRVEEMGTHEELMARGGRYFRLWQLQQMEAPAGQRPG